MIKESDIFDLLHSDDGMKIIEAKGILKQAPINGFLSGDNIDRIWFDKNIQAQESLLQLKIRIDSVISKMQIDLYKLEGECLQSGEYEFVKAREERIALMIANEPVLRDKKTSIEKLRSISYYVDGLLWSLRDLMKLFKR
ncbi:MAG: hypothetical protein HKO92_07040 [Flavobacteriaceae bacterium]|nr:hypothetical protein [Flavobacteriaceae bacterium]